MLVYAGDKIDKNYEIIGSIAVDTPGFGNDAMLALKSQAAAIGANAVINVKLTKLQSFVARTGLSGVAIRISDK